MRRKLINRNLAGCIQNSGERGAVMRSVTRLRAQLICVQNLEQQKVDVAAAKRSIAHYFGIMAQRRSASKSSKKCSRGMRYSGGQNVHPREVENVLAAHDGVAVVAIVGRQDAEWREAVTAVVVLKWGRMRRATLITALFEHA
jgi:hypothetical protein